MSTKSILKKSSIHFRAIFKQRLPTGFEAGTETMDGYLKPYVDTFITDTWNCGEIINPDAPYKVVIEGHADEISWYVNYITDDGLIYVIRNGGSDHQIAPSKRVNIHTKKNS
jgi:putative aminopeptidase FrvX